MRGPGISGARCRLGCGRRTDGLPFWETGQTELRDERMVIPLYTVVNVIRAIRDHARDCVACLHGGAGAIRVVCLRGRQRSKVDNMDGVVGSARRIADLVAWLGLGAPGTASLIRESGHLPTVDNAPLQLAPSRPVCHLSWVGAFFIGRFWVGSAQSRRGHCPLSTAKARRRVGCGGVMLGPDTDGCRARKHNFLLRDGLLMHSGREVCCTPYIRICD